METINYDPNLQLPTKPDWQSHFMKNQYIENNYFLVNEHPQTQLYIENDKKIEKQKYGLGFSAFITKWSFVYLGALYQARKQFIPGFFFFTNKHFNFLKASKYMAIGLIFGHFLSIFSFGHPFLVEDFIRRKFRTICEPQLFELGKYDQ